MSLNLCRTLLNHVTLPRLRFVISITDKWRVASCLIQNNTNSQSSANAYSSVAVEGRKFAQSRAFMDAICNKMSTNWWDRQNDVPLKFDPKPSEAPFSAVFGTSINADRK